MTKYLASILFSIALLPACVADDTEDNAQADVATGKADSASTFTPSGIYVGAGDVSRLELSSGAFRAVIADEISGTATHTGSFKLVHQSGHDYIDLLEGGVHHRLEYSPDLTIPETLMWVRWSSSQPWAELWRFGDDCATAGCDAGETCTSCFGDNVCMPAGTSC
ncbi:MAG TPA: hypothetical protein VMZ53_02380 [Kofleriaceae bacterium]|nr:hypothetical protein [Kofleriaceae bacterium]